MPPRRSLLASLAALGVAIALSAAMAGTAHASFPPNPVQTRLLPAGESPVDIALSADDSVYVVDQEFAGVLTVFSASLDDSRPFPAGTYPAAIAIDSNNPANPRDDSVYVSSPGDHELIVYSHGMDDSTIISFAPSVFPGPLAVDENDDTVYVGSWGMSPVVIALRGAQPDDSSIHLLQGKTQALAVDSVDDTLYIANGYAGSSRGLTYSGPAFDDSVFLPIPIAGYSPSGIAVNPIDDSVYVSLAAFGVAVPSRLISARGNFDDSHVITLDSAPSYNFLTLAVARDGSTVYSVDTTTASGPLYALRSTNPDDSAVVPLPNPNDNYPAAVAANGTTAYVANNHGDNMSVVRDAPAPAITSVSPPSGLPAGGNTVTVQGAGFVSLVSTLTLGGVTIPGALVTSPTTMTFTAPAHAAGSAAVTVTTGRLAATVPNGYSWIAPPPDPVFPPSAPRTVTAKAGDRSAAIAWLAPELSGSYPITSYRATATPGGQLCLVSAPKLGCDITGLTNGTSYTVAVEALNGAGWSDPSARSATFVPHGAIVIVGSRSAGHRGRLIRIDGRAPGLAGQTVIPRIKLAGQVRYRTGVVQPTVAHDATFAWSRLTDRKAYVYVKVAGARSNRVVIPPRR